MKWDRSLDEVYQITPQGRGSKITSEGTKWHYHQACEITAFTSGSGIRFVGDQVQNFESGSVVFLGSNLPHYWHLNGDSSGYAIQFYFGASHPFWAIPETSGLFGFLQQASRGIEFSKRISREIVYLMTTMIELPPLERLGLLFKILSILQQKHAEGVSKPLASCGFGLPSNTEQQHAVQLAMHYILTHYREVVQLSDLLNVTHMSKPTFCRYFKRYTGKSLNVMLQEIRIEATCRELLYSKNNITEIAYDCGFTQISFFNRVFTRLVGCSPTQYRNRVT